MAFEVLAGRGAVFLLLRKTRPKTDGHDPSSPSPLAGEGREGGCVRARSKPYRLDHIIFVTTEAAAPPPPRPCVWTGDILDGCTGTWWTHTRGIGNPVKEGSVPWEEKSVRSLGREFVVLAGRAGANMRGLCRRCGISPTTGYGWLARSRADGEAGLVDGSRGRRHSPERTPAA